MLKKSFPCQKNLPCKFYRFVFLTVALTLTVTAFASRTNAQLNLDTTYNAGVTDSFTSVYVSKPLSDGKVLVGGNFRLINGVEKNSLARLNADGTLDNTFNASGSGPNNLVYEITPLSNGKFLIGGGFTTYNGVSQSGIVRINADGSLDTTFNPSGAGTVGTVQTIALQTDGKILVSGSGIISYNGTTRFSVIRLNGDGTLDSSFTSPFTTSQFVEEVDVQADGKILIAGSFGIGSPQRADVARLNADGSLDTTFNPNGGGTDYNGIFAMIIQSDGKILIGGAFKTYNGTSRLGIARLNTDGSLDTAFNPNVGIGIGGGEYFAIQPDGKILVAGGFGISFYNTGLLRLNTDGSVDNSFASIITDGIGYQVSLQNDGKILLSGLFSNFNDAPRRNLVKLNTDGTIDNSLGSILFSTFSTVGGIAQQSDGKVIAAGNFNLANGVSHPSVARFNIDGSPDSSFNSGTGTTPDLNSSGNSLNDVAVQSNGKIIIGGNFNSYNGTSQVGVARLNANGDVDTSFNSPFLYYTNALVYDILVQSDGKILLGGIFGDANFNYVYLLRLNANGSLDTSFTGSPDNTVRSIAKQSDGKLIIGGTFSIFSGQSRNRLIRLNADGSVDNTFATGSGFNGTVLDTIQQADGKIIVVGTFTLFNGTSINRVARLNANGSLDNSFNVGNGASGTVFSVTIQANGKIVIGGSFSTFNNTSSNRLARLNTDGSLDTTVVSGFDNDSRFFVRRVLTLADDKVLVGGTFKTYNNITHNSLLRLTAKPPRSTMFDFDNDLKADLSVFRPSSSIWYLNRSTAGFTAVNFGIASDKTVPADYDGDGKTDVAVYRGGTWYIIRSSDGGNYQVSFGLPDDIPVPADFDGDGKADISVYRPSDGVWYRLNSSNGQYVTNRWGVAEDKPAIGDFDGDGKADLCVYRPSEGNWYLFNSLTNQFTVTRFGIAEDLIVPADYDGDGKTDIAVYRPSTSVWYRLNTSDGSVSINNFGISTDKPVAADYDGDGKTDVAIYRDGTWYILQSSNQQVNYGYFGTSEDRPLPNAYVR